MTHVNKDQTSQRSCSLGRLDASRVGETLRVVGWVHRRRDLGGLLFLDLRDRTGLLQVSLGPDWTTAEGLASGRTLGSEDVVAIEGELALRPEDARNPEMSTGEVELRAERVELLNGAVTPAIPVYRAPDEELPSEELRLRHRVLDLRRPELQARLLLRHRLVLETRNYLSEQGFTEIETPILTKPTPEGARDYLVPSRVHPGEFYALPQSPQIYKQILMAAGFDRYFQIARCFRDEDLRADRQPEFTQIDLEASFIEPADIYGWMEGLMERLATVAEIEAPTPFQRLSYADALNRYGSDRPDLRYALEIADWSGPLGALDSGILRSALEGGGRIRGMVLPGGAGLSRREIEALEAEAKSAGAPGLLWFKRTADGGTGPLSRFMTPDAYAATESAEGDLVVVAAGDDGVTSPALAATRGAAIQALDLPAQREHAWLWVTDFPLFETVPGGGRLTATHHPFVLPHADDSHRLGSDPLSVRGHAYDLVYNGTELGSGSLRCHDPGLQRRLLAVLGMDDAEIDRRFGFLLQALGSGAPPHGGIALGMDRIVKDFSGAQSLRDVIAFPKTTAARALFEGAPVPVSSEDLAELRIRVESGTDD
jgi:aspartyl-tRNA synthetase